MTQQLNTHGIGASEISAIAGVNPYASPWDIWLVKTGQREPFAGNEKTDWGHRLEPAIRQAYADQTHATIYVPPGSLYHEQTPWARATPDGITLDPFVKPGDGADRAGWDSLLQIKNVGTWVERSWRDAPPAYVQLQEQWEMYVTGLRRADIACLIGGSDFRIYTVHRDDKLITDLVTIASDFWRLVETKTPPKIDASDACREHLERRLANRQAVEMNADAELDAQIGEWQRLHLESKRIETETDRVRNVVRAALADAGAERIVSSHGVPFVKERAGSKTTNWRLIAELLGSTKCTPNEFQTLVAANTEQKPASLTLYAPKQWAKENL